MLLKLFFAMLAVMIFAGCSSHRARKTGGNDHKVTISMDISEAVPEVKPSQTARTEPARRKAAERPPAVAPHKKSAPGKKKNAQRISIIPPPVSIDSDLNDVEQQYLREIRQKQQQQKRDSERHVFGGFSGK